MTYTIIAITDGKETWKKSYNNCVDAVHEFDKFKDHGTCVFDYTITLVEPDGKLNTKTFLYPYGSEENRQRALDRLGYPPDLSRVK